MKIVLESEWEGAYQKVAEAEIPDHETPPRVVIAGNIVYLSYEEREDCYAYLEVTKYFITARDPVKETPLVERLLRRIS